MRYDLRDLQLLVAVVEAGGIAAAARRVHLSVSALSERITALEDGAGLPLLTRGARGSAPTPAGLELAAHARAVLLQTERLDGAVAAWRGREQGEVRVMANSNALASFLPDVLARFLARHPDVQIDLREALSDEIARAIRAGEAELGVAAGTADLSGLEVRPFRKDRLVLLVPAGHPLAARRRVSYAETLDEPFVGLDEGAAIQTYIADHAARLGRSLKPRIRLRSFEGVARMVAAGAGVAIVPASTVTRVQRDNGIRVVDLTDSWSVRDLVICIPTGRVVPRLVERLAESLCCKDEGP
ncbi:LysR substrate-binding domain-containing protein [Roseomonas sp. ACRSG]|nr:LysR substrate-binding domain-containing protein [Roseomonas sp. ACRSG]